jgi:hypothetical protein
MTLLSSTTEMLPSKGKNRSELSLQSLQVMLIICQRRDIEIAAILAKLDPPPVNFSMVAIFTFSHFLTTSSFFLLLSSSTYFLYDILTFLQPVHAV